MTKQLNCATIPPSEPLSVPPSLLYYNYSSFLATDPPRYCPSLRATIPPSVSTSPSPFLVTVPPSRHNTVSPSVRTPPFPIHATVPPTVPPSLHPCHDHSLRTTIAPPCYHSSLRPSSIRPTTPTSTHSPPSLPACHHPSIFGSLHFSNFWDVLVGLH